MVAGSGRPASVWAWAEPRLERRLPLGLGCSLGQVFALARAVAVGGTGVGVAVAVGSGVAVDVAVTVGTGVAVGRGGREVAVGGTRVAVGTAVAVGVGVSVAVTSRATNSVGSGSLAGVHASATAVTAASKNSSRRLEKGRFTIEDSRSLRLRNSENSGTGVYAQLLRTTLGYGQDIRTVSRLPRRFFESLFP